MYVKYVYMYTIIVFIILLIVLLATSIRLIQLSIVLLVLLIYSRDRKQCIDIAILPFAILLFQSLPNLLQYYCNTIVPIPEYIGTTTFNSSYMV